MAESQKAFLGTGDRIAIAIGFLAAGVAVAAVAFEHAYPDATTNAWRVILFVSVAVAVISVIYLIYDLVLRPRLRDKRPTLPWLKSQWPRIAGILIIITALGGGLCSIV